MSSLLADVAAVRLDSGCIRLVGMRAGCALAERLGRLPAIVLRVHAMRLDTLHVGFA